jgi:hypothetical protein
MILWKILFLIGLMENPANIQAVTILDLPSSVFIVILVIVVALGGACFIRGVWWLLNH